MCPGWHVKTHKNSSLLILALEASAECLAQKKMRLLVNFQNLGKHNKNHYSEKKTSIHYKNSWSIGNCSIGVRYKSC